MKKSVWIAFWLFGMAWCSSAGAAEILIGPQASPIEQLAAKELQRYPWLLYKKVDCGAGVDQVEIEAASFPGARVEFRLRDADGPLLGQGVIPKTGGWQKYQTVAVPIKRTAGVQTLCIAFSADVYPRQELTKANGQLAIVDHWMAQVTPTQRQRLGLLRTRLAAVRDHIRLMLEFPDFTAGPESYLTYVAKGTNAFTDMEEDFDGASALANITTASPRWIATVLKAPRRQP